MKNSFWQPRFLFGFVYLCTASTLWGDEPAPKIDPLPDSNGGLRVRMICSDQATDGRMALLRDYPGIEVLEAFGSEGFSDAGLVHLSSLPKLRSLALGGEHLTAAGLESIRGKASLKMLTINEFVFTPQLAELLCSLPNLEYLRLRPESVEPGAWKILARAPRLRELLITNTMSAADSAELAGLEDFTQLQKLTLYRSGFTSDSIAKFSSNKHLRELSLMMIPLTDEAGAVVAQFSELEKLSIHYATATPGALKALEGHPRLRHFQINSDDLQPGDLLAFKPFHSLRTLDVSGRNISEAATHDLRSALHDTVVNRFNWKHNVADLESISRDVERNTAGDVVSVTMLCHEPATDAKVGILHQFPTIEKLCLFGGDNLTDVGMMELRTVKMLREVEIHSRAITDEGLLHLKDCAQLTTIHLGASQVTPAGIAKLKELLPNVAITIEE